MFVRFNPQAFPRFVEGNWELRIRACQPPHWILQRSIIFLQSSAIYHLKESNLLKEAKVKVKVQEGRLLVQQLVPEKKENRVKYSFDCMFFPKLICMEAVVTIRRWHDMWPMCTYTIYLQNTSQLHLTSSLTLLGHERMPRNHLLYALHRAA